MRSRKNKYGINSEIIRELVDLLDEHGLSELEYGTGDWHARVARGGGGRVVQTEVQGTGETSGSGAFAALPGAVKSPMVGTAFLSPEPGAPDFVKTGDEVKEGDTLLLIEAMKTFNQIRAPKNGKVVQILVVNGQPVEYGEVLVVLE